MASYDSESSGDEGEAYTETNVLLGYASEEPTDDTISQLGGHPTWLDRETTPSGSLAKCKVCNGLLTLLLQLNGDLPERFPGHERRLYLLGCKKKTCRRKDGSVRGFRATRASRIPANNTAAPTPVAAEQPAPAQPKEKTDIGASLFGVKPSSTGSSPLNPFSSNSSSPQASSNPFASASSLAAKPPQPAVQTTSKDLAETFASKARISASSSSTPEPSSSGPAEPWPDLSSFPQAYPTYHLDADYETLEAQPSEIPNQTRVDMDIDGEGSGSSGSAADMKDAFESSMDKTFQRFADRLAQNPEQVIRYEFGGQPLLYSKTDAVGRVLGAHEGGQGKVQTAGRSGGKAPRCGNCGAERVFEVQLTPHAITELEAEELGLEGMEWGTVVLEVCAKDCVQKGIKENEVGYAEEWVGVQWEELARR